MQRPCGMELREVGCLQEQAVEAVLPIVQKIAHSAHQLQGRQRSQVGALFKCADTKAAACKRQVGEAAASWHQLFQQLQHRVQVRFIPHTQSQVHAAAAARFALLWLLDGVGETLQVQWPMDRVFLQSREEQRR